jgi:single-stranded DNA-binding protein
MQNNWVLLQGHLCHTPNYASTRKGLHKVSFRLAVPRFARAVASTPTATSSETEGLVPAPETPSPTIKSDYVTVIIIGKPAWDFKQLDLQTGAAVRVEGRLRSWDFFPDQADSSAVPVTPVATSQDSRHDYHLEVIAEKVDPLDGLSN